MQKKTIQYLSIAFFVLLIIWGFYALFYYLGVPYHGLVLLDRPVFDKLADFCKPDEFFCRGIRSFWPFVENSIKRAAPFLWYAIISIAVFSAWVVFTAFKTGSLRLKWTLRPWHFAALFLAMLWLLFTVLSGVSSGNGQPPRRLVEPLPQVYQNVGEEGLKTLRDNLDDLEKRGCLVPEGQFDNGARSYLIKRTCIQKSFFTRVLPLFAFVMFIIFEFLIAGRMVLKRLKFPEAGLLAEAAVSAAMGACVLIAVLWTMAVASLHVPFLKLYSAPAGWALMAGVLIVGARHAAYWIRQFIFAGRPVDRLWRDPAILLGWLLVTYLALNFLSVVRPFPIGWDDLGSYLNRPRLMVSYGHFIFSMAPFFWEYLTSLGFLLFGYASHFGVSSAMMINWSAGLMAAISVFVFANHFLGSGKGILAALIYYTLPMVGHFSFADMKIDNAVFTMSAMSAFCIFAYLFPREEAGDQVPAKRNISIVIAAGVFAGFAFAIKPTAIMAIIPLGAIMLGVLLHWSAFIAVFFLAIALYSWEGMNVERTLARMFGEGAAIPPWAVLTIFLTIGLCFLAFLAFKNREKFPSALKASAVFAVTFIISVSPWIIHNNLLQGGRSISLLFKAPNDISPVLYIYGQEEVLSGKVVRTLSNDIAVDRNNPACSPTGGEEELDRYWGFEKGIIKHYLTLPWRTAMNLNSTGYYVTTMPALLLLPLTLLLPFFWMKRGRWARWLFAGTLFMIFEWMLLANGIIWYGIGMFLGLAILLEVLCGKSPDIFGRAISGTLIGMSLVSVLAMRIWQYETQKNLLEYPIGKASAEVMIERTVPHYDDVAEDVVKRAEEFPDRPYLYRVGTFIPYFIPKNLEIIGISDHQLDFFNCIYQERKPELTVKRLKSLGFNSIVFDTNTATIEKDPNGTLHQKVNAFLDFVNNPASKLNVVLSDTKGGIAFILIP